MKIKVALLFGGRSPEHEISILSAKNIYQAINKDQYELTLIGISRQGSWHHLSLEEFLSDQLNIAQSPEIMLAPGSTDKPLRLLSDPSKHLPVEVIFPITHGPYGEDGSLQGLLKHLYIPFVGPDVAASAISMDKDICKRLLKEADLLVAPSLTFYDYEQDAIDYRAVVNKLGSPLFIKPANMGSSVGVSKAGDAASFRKAVAAAFKFDTKIIIEEAIVGRELECAIMGNQEIVSTTVGEVKMKAGFYDYESKYEREDSVEIEIPACDIDEQMQAKLIQVAQQSYRVLNCEGLSRVDMFLCEDGQVYVNEVNTLPGFTNISMYPKLWEHTGLPYTDLITQLIELAREKNLRETILQRNK